VVIQRTTLVLAGIAVVAIGALVGFGIAVLHDSNAAAPTTPQHTSAAAPTTPQHTSAAARSAPASSAANSAAGLDSCVVGSWKTVSQTVTNYVNGEPAVFTGHGGAGIFTLRPDGTGAIGGSGTGTGGTLTANVGGHIWTEVVAGTATFNYQTSSGSLLLSNMQASGTQTLYVDGVKTVTAPFSPKSSAKYTCAGNTLKLFSADGTGSTELARNG